MGTAKVKQEEEADTRIIAKDEEADKNNTKRGRSRHKDRSERVVRNM